MKNILRLYYLKLVFVIIWNIYIKRFISFKLIYFKLETLVNFINALIILLETILLNNKSLEKREMEIENDLSIKKQYISKKIGYE